MNVWKKGRGFFFLLAAGWLFLPAAVSFAQMVSFDPATNFPVGLGPAHSVAIGDLNGDGKLDLATANTGSNDVSVLLGTGTSSFASAPGSCR